MQGGIKTIIKAFYAEKYFREDNLLQFSVDGLRPGTEFNIDGTREVSKQERLVELFTVFEALHDELRDSIDIYSRKAVTIAEGDV